MTRDEIDAFIDDLGIETTILIPDNLDEGFLGVIMDTDEGDPGQSTL